MGTEIKAWQIVNGKLTMVKTELKNEGRTEPYDLEPWIESNPEIISTDIVIIGRQVMTKSGPLDLLGFDRSGNLVVIEIKRAELPREALAQAIDYASDISEWTTDKIGEVCSEYSGKSLDDYVSESFPDIDFENLSINSTQRIILVGFSIESALERMIEWLSSNFNVNINAIILNYIKTTNGDELLSKTSIISEELEQERAAKRKHWDESSFAAKLLENKGAEFVKVSKEIMEWSKSWADSIYWGEGTRSGSFIPWINKNRNWYIFFDLWTYGAVEIQFQCLSKRPGFADESLRLKLREKLNRIAGVDIPIDSVSKRPSFSMDILKEPQAMELFKDSVKWAIGIVKDSVISSKTEM